MSFALLRLIVLGKIPGTDFTFGFWLFFAVIFILTLVFFYSKMLRIAGRLLRQIDPFRGAPKELSYIDLTAL